VVARSAERRVDCADIAGPPVVEHYWRLSLAEFERRNRRPVVIAITTDGRRVQLPVDGNGLTDVSLLGILRSILLGLDGLLGLITGSRRENGGTRRGERR